jgi:hypothetical protein
MFSKITSSPWINISFAIFKRFWVQSEGYDRSAVHDKMGKNIYKNIIHVVQAKSNIRS